jgi:hypothetical protein
MKKIVLVFTILLSIQLIAEVNQNPVALVIKTKGKTVVKRNKEEIKIEQYMPLYINDKIKTYSASFVELLFDTGICLRIEEKSVFELKKFVQYTYEDKTKPYINFGFKLYKGTVLTDVDVFNNYNFGSLHIVTPTSVVSVRGTVFYVNVDDDENTKIVVFKGKVECLITEITDDVFDKLFEEEFYELKKSVVIEEEQQTVFTHELVLPAVTSLSFDMIEYKKSVVNDFVKLSQRYRKEFEEFKERRNKWIEKHKEQFKKDIIEQKNKFKKEFYR